MNNFNRSILNTVSYNSVVTTIQYFLGGGGKVCSCFVLDFGNCDVQKLNVSFSAVSALIALLNMFYPPQYEARTHLSFSIEMGNTASIINNRSSED